MDQNAKSFTNRRRYKAYLGIFGLTQLHLRNPFIIAFWSAMFPGFGHLILCKYLCGYILIIWEIVINSQSHINNAILYTFTGRFDMAKQVIDINWAFLYIPTYLFAIWDSYRTAVDLNHQFVLASREDASINTFALNTIEINYLDKKSPIVTFLLSVLTPGLGYFYIYRLPSSVFILICWITIIVYSKALPSILYTFMGDFSRSTSILNHQWFLDIPSIYFASIYDSYLKTVENNKLFEWEQSKFLSTEYQSPNFVIPSLTRKDRSDSMHIVSTFEQSIHLEEAITALQMKGVDKKDILAIPLDKRGEDKQLFDTIHSSDGLSLLDIPMILASILTLFGSIYGFVLYWGPIIWGLIGMIIGFSIGLLIKLFTMRKFSKKKFPRGPKSRVSEVVVIVECDKNLTETVKDILWNNNALGVRKLILGKDI